MPKTSPAKEKIQEIRQEVNLLFSQAARFQGVKEDQNYRMLEEQLLQKQKFIDQIETGGCEKVRRMHRNLTRQIFSCLGLLDRRAMPEEDVSTPTEQSDDKFSSECSFRALNQSHDHSRVGMSPSSTSPQDNRFVSGQRSKRKRKKLSWAYPLTSKSTILHDIFDQPYIADRKQPISKTEWNLSRGPKYKVEPSECFGENRI